MENIQTNIIYNDTNRKITFNINNKIGKIQENILSICNLYIYAIEYTEIEFEDGSIYILGDNNFSFNINYKDIIEKENKKETNIKYFRVLDRKRDENGNVIKDNLVIEKYLKFIREEENEEFLNSFNRNLNSNPFNNVLNQNVLNSIFSTSFQDFNQANNNMENLPFNQLFGNNNLNNLNNLFNINSILNPSLRRRNQNRQNERNTSDAQELNEENDKESNKENINNENTSGSEEVGEENNESEEVEEENDESEEVEEENGEENGEENESQNENSPYIQTSNFILEFRIPQNLYGNLDTLNSNLENIVNNLTNPRRRRNQTNTNEQTNNTNTNENINEETKEDTNENTNENINEENTNENVNENEEIINENEETVRIDHIIQNELNDLVNTVNMYVQNYRTTPSRTRMSRTYRNVSQQNNNENAENNNNENVENNNDSNEEIGEEEIENNMMNEIRNPFMNVDIRDEETESVEETKEDVEEEPNRENNIFDNNEEIPSETIRATAEIFSTGLNSNGLFGNNLRSYTRNYRPLRTSAFAFNNPNRFGERFINRSGLGTPIFLNNFNELENIMTTIFMPSGNFQNMNYEDVKIVMNEEEFNNLPRIQFNSECLNQDCTICMESFENEETLLKTPCEHCFHEECIKNWFLKESIKCPFCRKEVCKGTPKLD